ncbi:MAG: SLC13 family permease, partial [Candidatus Syntropharchaeia archaeon]
PETLWFALALGASFGGIGTMTGTASSIVGIGLLEGHIKRKISYVEYLKIGFPVMMLCNAISTLYIILLHIVMKG